MNIFITGASQGIGKELAKLYSAKTNNVVLAARNLQALEEIADKFKNKGNVHIVSCDVSDKIQCKAAYDFAVEKLGHIDMAILNAGISGSESFTDFTSEHFKQIFDINVFGVVHFLELLLPEMLIRQEGTIVGVSSLADSRGMPGSGAYCASKAALSHILEAARAELNRKNIRIVTVRPGFVRTNMTAKNDFKMPFLMDVDKAAEIIYTGIENGKKRIDFPLPTAISSNLGKIIPGAIFDMFAKYIKVFK